MQIQAKDPWSPPETTLSPHIQDGGEAMSQGAVPEARAGQQQQGGLWARGGDALLAPHAPFTCHPPTPPRPPSVSPFPGSIPLGPVPSPPPPGASVRLRPVFPIQGKDEGPRLAVSLPCGHCFRLGAAPPLSCVPARASTQLRTLGARVGRHLSPPGGAPRLSQIHPSSLSPPKISFRFRSLAVTRSGPFHAQPGQAWCVRRNGLWVPEGRGWGPPPG